MDRRKAIKIAAGAVVGSGAGMITLSNAFKPEYQPLAEPQKLKFSDTQSNWIYYPLDPALTAELAYKFYDSGSCMYATCSSIISQLADNIGEPYTSFPLHMMKYGHGGIGGFGTICGALNGAAAIIGLLIADKIIRDSLITGIFRWYEEAKLPEFRPKVAIKDFTPPPAISNSTLCHASNTNWTKAAGYKIDSDERKERCRRLTSDVTSRLTIVLNNYCSNIYMTDVADNKPIRECMTCHSDKGKISNTNANMSCDACHTESVGHKIFSDIHYKLMKSK